MSCFPTGKKALALLCLLFSGVAAPLGHGQGIDQATVQAAMTLKLLSFATWPEEKGVDENSILEVGIFGTEESVEPFRALLNDERYSGRYVVKAIDSNTPVEELASLEALYFSAPEPTEIPRLLRKIDNQAIVLVGAFEGFLEEGGVVNLVRRQRRLTFEIHLGNAERRGIEFRSKLLRLASRIIEE